MVIPGPEDQAFLRGLLAGSGISTTTGTFAGLFFNANAYSPGQVISNNSTLPQGVSGTDSFGEPVVGSTLVTQGKQRARSYQRCPRRLPMVAMNQGGCRLRIAGLLGVHGLWNPRR